jgi:hypothetical protein
MEMQSKRNYMHHGRAIYRRWNGSPALARRARLRRTSVFGWIKRVHCAVARFCEFARSGGCLTFTRRFHVTGLCYIGIAYTLCCQGNALPRPAIIFGSMSKFYIELQYFRPSQGSWHGFSQYDHCRTPSRSTRVERKRSINMLLNRFIPAVASEILEEFMPRHQ